VQDIDEQVTAEEIEDGTYFREGRQWYSDLFHHPIAERSYFVIIILLSLINVFYAVSSFIGVFPITTRVPFITYSNDVNEDLPRIKRLTLAHGEDKNLAVMRYLLQDYVSDQESYEFRLYELRYRGVWSESKPDVFEKYKAKMDTSNPYSPYRLYTDQQRRVITFDSISYMQSPDGKKQARIVFEASVRNLDDNEINHTKWQADITYDYGDFTVEQRLPKRAWVARLPLISRVLHLTDNEVSASGDKHKVIPMTFSVSDYQVKELLE
jgi:type IV secretory pathway component VirB8